MKTIFCIAGFVFASFAASATGGDTTKVKYDLNDPRNPDCPCHQYQKLADEEYQRMLGENAVQNASENLADNINKTKERIAPELTAMAAEDAGAKMMKDSNKTTGTKKVNKSVFHRRSGSHHGNTQPKKRRIRFGRKDNSRCTHW